MIHFEVWIECVVLDYFLISELGPFDLAVGAADRREPALHFLNRSRRPLHLPHNSVVLCVYTKATQSKLLAGFDRVLSVENACWQWKNNMVMADSFGAVAVICQVSPIPLHFYLELCQKLRNPERWFACRLPCLPQLGEWKNRLILSRAYLTWARAGSAQNFHLCVSNRINTVLSALISMRQNCGSERSFCLVKMRFSKCNNCVLPVYIVAIVTLMLYKYELCWR